MSDLLRRPTFPSKLGLVGALCCLAAFNLNEVSAAEPLTQWFFHGFEFPRKFARERAGDAAGWKETASRYCSGRVFRAAHDINDKLQKLKYPGGRILQGDIAVRIDNIGGVHADIYLYCNAEASIYITVGHYSGNVKDKIWEDLYKIVYNEFAPDRNLETAD